MKIYVITQGIYSDYHICGVATTKEKAEMMQKFFSTDYDKAEIETYDTDTYEPIGAKFKPFCVVFDKDYNYSFIECVPHERISSNIEFYKVIMNHNYYHINVWAEDEHHARKIAYDIINIYKYNKEGV